MKLSDLVKTEVIKIPNTDLEITIKTELSWFDQMEIAKDHIESETDLGKLLSVRLITDWNLEEEEGGKKLAITKEVVERLPAYVMMPIVNKITEIAHKKTEKKKDLAKALVFFFQGARSNAPNEYLNYILCEKFGWTYQELMSQPSDFIEELLFVMKTETDFKKWQKQT